MRQILKSALLLVFLLTSLSVLAEGGVSKKLAIYRASAISDVRYDLRFTVPGQLSQAVTGWSTVTFDYRGSDDLVIDFTGKLLDVGKNAVCMVNGRAAKDVRQEDEHIVVPAKWLRKGKNTLAFRFESSNASLNRHEDYMYTLFVPANARSCFPCFDQPDLKARFTLQLNCPEGWTSLDSAVGQPLPTYLFSFVCGKFQKQTVERDGRTLTALYRETDSTKVAQLGKVFDEAALSLRWMEQFTGIPLPFDRYGFVVLPGFQFGGMEHPGAIQFNDKQIFLGPNPTPDEELTRLELIAHETAHMWFGDLVTMRWFDDVWTKEVFANFLANQISHEVFPEINHDLNFLKSYQVPALSVDRTEGTHAIQQPLDNLRDAGLLYGRIIYDKAPVMMRMLSTIQGKDNQDWFREGLRAYLRRHSYGNATWDELVNILDSVAPAARIKEFSNAWVKQKGLPLIGYQAGNGTLKLTQTDPYGRGVSWSQQFDVALDYGDSTTVRHISMSKPETVIPLEGTPRHVYPNTDGRGYGRFVISSADMDGCLDCLATLRSPMGGRGHQAETAVYSLLLNMHENYLMGRLDNERYFKALTAALDRCGAPLLASTLISCIATVRHHAPDSLRHAFERTSLHFALSHPLRSARQQMLRSLSTTASDADVVSALYNMWEHQNDTSVLEKGLLTTRDYTRMAWHLAIAVPERCAAILSQQRQKQRTDDERSEFDYVSRACTADTAELRRMFLGLLPKEGRTVEPWAEQMLALLCCREREPLCNSFILPALDSLLMIQQTSDIFFPGDWLSALLYDQHSTEARRTVAGWIEAHKDYPPTLMNKLKQAAFGLMTALPGQGSATDTSVSDGKHAESDISQMRKDIDELDDKLIQLLADRLEVYREVGLYKQKRKMAVVQSKRFEELLQRHYAQGAQYGMSKEFVKALFDAIHSESVRQQQSLTVPETGKAH